MNKKIKIPVSVLIPAKNEEINLPKCLERLKRFDQIMLLDSQSSDNTILIAESFGAEVHQFHWDGKFPKKRNWALRNLNIKNDWVLFLDADEYVDEAFVNEVAQKVQSIEYVGFWITYTNVFMGKVLKYGYPLKKLPLFKLGAGEYEKIDEDSWSHLDMEVHEHPILDGKIGEIKTPVLHNDYKGMEHYIAKHNAYSSWEAHRFFNNGLAYGDMTLPQKIKYTLLKIGLLPLGFFIGSYVFMGGFLDGYQGYIVARYKANYFFQIQTKLKELKSKK